MAPMSEAQERALKRYRSNPRTKLLILEKDRVRKRLYRAKQKVGAKGTPSAPIPIPENNHHMEDLAGSVIDEGCMEHGTCLPLNRTNSPFRTAPGALLDARQANDHDDDEANGRGSPDLQHSFDGPFSQTDMARKLRCLRLKYHKWTYRNGWGAENRWAQAFTVEYGEAEERGQNALAGLFRSLEDHNHQGRRLLEELKGGGHLSKDVCNDPGVIRDIFLQSFELLTTIVSEVRFIETKIDENVTYDYI
ncbi:hypothetical protein FIBSPDRAFT_960477 [Athelia psychrophila]|uniref:Uncharacterized protein n=1 Tax=Athelia psychrophila TaxID=1759441 RepID=A0A166CE01_9AGAM|nr:hypothetical protein FIBSPDRAFT_960477 [Fibularhizoctonia sp. CBS 109695]